MLSDNDKKRIEQAAKLSWKNTITAFEDSDEISFWEGYLTGAEYCTLYERQQQAALKELNRTLYESNERQAVVISEFKQEGSSERARANNAVGKYWETLQANKKLEAERSELTKEIADLKAWKQSEMQLWRPIIEYMQSNGHLFGMKLGESINEKVLEVLKLNSRNPK